MPPPTLQQTHDTADGADRRIAPHRRALKNALIVFNSRYCTHRCFILNMSDTGAQLMPQDAIECPSEFVLNHRSGKNEIAKSFGGRASRSAFATCNRRSRKFANARRRAEKPARICCERPHPNRNPLPFLANLEQG
jgi:hypothetical protein